MMRKSLLLLTTAMLIVPSTASLADKKDDRRERVRQEAPSAAQGSRLAQARASQARDGNRLSRQGIPQTDRRDVSSVPGRQRAAQEYHGRKAYTPARQDRAVKQSARTQAVPERRQDIRQVQSRRIQRTPTIDKPKAADRRDVHGMSTFRLDKKVRTKSVYSANSDARRSNGRDVKDRGRHVNDNHDRRGRNDHRSRDNNHRSRDGHHSRSRNDRRDYYYRGHRRSNTRIYIGIGTNPYGYWGRPHYYGHYTYSDWPFYSGYWHARSHWSWHMHHSHYHYGGYCPGLDHGYSASYHYSEPSYYASSFGSNQANEVVGTILGGVVGGILGSEIDGGRNRTAGVVVGSLLGATLGNSIARSNSRTVSSGYRYTADYYGDDPTIREYDNGAYSPPGKEIRKCIEYDVNAGNYVCRRWVVEYEN
ncbi:glycine zipper 2TM domain-containing protein [Kordiimonas sp.]|uniref:glycine zipper 2TM domain-containing protein n=1 Tax=Kordiimonas sp. TaxID=1970157 RepID=UPI003A8DF651